MRGPAVLGLQRTWLRDWAWATDNEPELSWYAESVGEMSALVLATGPVHDELDSCWNQTDQCSRSRPRGVRPHATGVHPFGSGAWEFVRRALRRARRLDRGSTIRARHGAPVALVHSPESCTYGAPLYPGDMRSTVVLSLSLLLLSACACAPDPVGPDGAVRDGAIRDGDAPSAHDGDPGLDGALPPSSCVSPAFDPLADFRYASTSPDRLVTTAADDGPGSLRAILAEVSAGEVVGFDASLAGMTIALESELLVPVSIVLDATGAPGLTLDGQSTTRIMSIAKGRNSVLVGLTFLNGRTDGPGGALHVQQADEGQPEGRVEIAGCRFEHNRGGRGGAVRVGWRINAVIRDSVFRDNDGSMGMGDDRGFSGGAIATSQDASEGLRVERCLFERNVGTIAGAVYNILEPVVVEDSVFIDNVATNGSGAFFSDGGNTVGPGNDPISGEVGQITLRRVWMQGSMGRTAGGAMLLWGYPRDVITLEDVVVLDSHCLEAGGGSTESKGGAARIHGLDTISIERSVFARNRAEQQGGALWIDGTADVSMVNTTFSENHVERDQGGAFTFNGSGSLRLQSCAFLDNHAGRACGAFWWGASDQDIEVTNSVFARNTAGDLAQRHVREPRPRSGGGNVEWVEGDPDRGRIWADSVFADPLVGDLAPLGCGMGREPAAGSPLVDAAVDPAPRLDGAGRERDARPDIGPIERL